jgi:hypothetical protein
MLSSVMHCYFATKSSMVSHLGTLGKSVLNSSTEELTLKKSHNVKKYWKISGDVVSESLYAIGNKRQRRSRHIAHMDPVKSHRESFLDAFRRLLLRSHIHALLG